MMKLSLLGSGLLLTALLLNGCGPSAAPDKAGESVFRYGTTHHSLRCGYGERRYGPARIL